MSNKEIKKFKSPITCWWVIRTYYLNMTKKSTQILRKFSQFQKKIPKNVTIFLENFLKVPLTMLLGTF